MRQFSVSWHQRHRLGQIAVEKAAGVVNPHYTVKAERISPRLDRGALERAWHAVTVAHPLLLSAFDIEDARWWLPDERMTGLVVACAPAEFATRLTAPFDYASGPVARMVLAADDDCSLVGIAVDHLVSDG